MAQVISTAVPHSVKESACYKQFVERIPTLPGYASRLRPFVWGEALVRYRETVEELSFMLEGRAKAFRVMENGRSVLHAVMEAPAVIGDLELLLGYPQATTDVRAISEGILLSLPLDRCKEQLLQDSQMLRFLGGELAGKLERSSRVGAQNDAYPLSARLAAYLLFSARDGVVCENMGQVSGLLSTSYRHLMRTLSVYCEKGYVERCPGGYRIVDLEGLAREGSGILREER